jgi:hypothetical protein
VQFTSAFEAPKHPVAVFPGVLVPFPQLPTLVPKVFVLFIPSISLPSIPELVQAPPLFLNSAVTIALQPAGIEKEVDMLW